MKHIRIETLDTIDYQAARAIAARFASQDAEMEEPVLLAWHDRPHGRMSPDIAGADLDSHWRDYGEAHGGCLEVSIGGAYDFIFTDGAPFGDYGPSPYVNLTDARGNQYLCHAGALRGAKTPTAAACQPLDEYTSKLT